MNDELKQEIDKILEHNDMKRDPYTPLNEALLSLFTSHQLKLLDRVDTEVIGEDEQSKYVRRFQCPNYGNGCFEWAEQWKMNSEPPYCSTDGRKMKSVEFDEPEGNDWERNEMRAEQRTKLESIKGELK